MEFSIISCHGGWFPFVETKSQINPIVRFFELVSKYTKHLPLSLHNNADKAFTVYIEREERDHNIHTSRSYIHCNYSCIEKLVPKRSQCFLLNRVSVCVTMYSIQAKVTSNFGLQAFELIFFAIFAWLHGTSM